MFGLTVFYFSFLFAALFPFTLKAATVDPSFEFLTFETEHFAIHHHQGLKGIPLRAADIAEEAHRLLVPVLGWEPEEKTHLVLIDDSDLTGGFASVLPYNWIYVKVQPPMPDMGIGQYDEWLRLVILHEYAHILTMDPERGYSEVMRSIFGRPVPSGDPLSIMVFLLSAPPNVFMPNWWTEGVATWAESEFAQTGRGKGTYYDMLFRTAVSEDNLLPIDGINGNIPYWPGRSTPYIYGLALMRHLAERQGREDLGRLSLLHAGRAPFFISRPPYDVTGKTYSVLYSEMAGRLKNEMEKNIETLKERPFTAFKTLDIKGEVLTNPRPSPDGRYLALNVRDPRGHESIVIVERNGLRKTASVRRNPSDHNITWSPDSKRIYFTQAEFSDGYNFYQELYFYDVRKDESGRLTNGMRLKDADLSPDGKTFAAVTSRPEGQKLVLLDAETLKGKDIFAVPSGERLSGPRWSPDGGSVVFSNKPQGEKSELWIFKIGQDGPKKIIEDENTNVYPAWTPDGRYILFVSDRTGVYNIFAYRLSDGRTLQATHLLGGAFQPEASGGEILFSSYHSKGFDIAHMEYDPVGWTEDEGPKIKPYWPSETNGEKDAKSCPPPPDLGDAKPYSPFETLRPRFWLPTFWTDEDGAVIGAYTAGRDVLGYHAYALNPAVGTEGDVYFTASYVYDRHYPTFVIRGYSVPVLYSEFFGEDDDYWERQSGLRVSVSLPMRRLEKDLRLVLGYELLRQERLTEGGGLPVFEGRRDGVFAGIEFDNTLRYPYSVSREEGVRASYYVMEHSKDIGSDVGSRRHMGSFEEYFGLGGHHVIYLKLKGAVSDGEVIPQQAFQMGGEPGGVLEFPLRGYPSGFRTGRYIATGSLEYRAPVKNIFRGPNTKPFFWQKAHGAVFADFGTVWGLGRDFNWDDVKVGVGAEARLDMVLGYKLSVTPALGFAYGLSEDGEARLYLTIYADL